MKGTAFDDHERVALGLHGLLPPHVKSLEEQSVRALTGLNLVIGEWFIRLCGRLA